MKSNKTLTFVVPAYNAVKYLKRNIESFLVEECLDDIEILIINDGSSDNTSEFAKSYEEKYPDSVRVIDKPNGGHGSGINKGSAEATGKYFKVIDADDWIVSKNLKSFIDELKMAETDVVLTPFHMIDDNTGEVSTFFDDVELEYDKEYTLSDLNDNWKAFHNYTLFHAITYKTAFYNENRHELTEKVFYEDAEYSAIPFCKAASILPINTYIYEYRVGGSDQSMSDDNRIKRLSHSEKVTESMVGYYLEETLDEAGREYLIKKIMMVSNSHYKTLFVLCKDKKKADIAAKRYNELLISKTPEIWNRLEKNYKTYKMMGVLHMTDKTYDRIINSRLYKTLRGR